MRWKGRVRNPCLLVLDDTGGHAHWEPACLVFHKLHQDYQVSYNCAEDLSGKLRITEIPEAEPSKSNLETYSKHYATIKVASSQSNP